ncbi:hypothetical protein HPULCUR_002685 [Helicostylum pulchrum]|uniref:Uncharacterized protein n=1 Tax=Helicostylum pulchrum TaxID=562976 RepID=A0ABP9XR77_9FUNG
MAPAKRESSEKELEGFLFGDDTEELWEKTGHELDQQLDEPTSEQEATEEEEDTEEAFFFDSGPVSYTIDAPVAINHDSDSEVDYEAEEGEQNTDNESDSESEDESDKEDNNAAWEDDDDKRLMISLSASNITKKLRNDVDEDIVDGAEYSRRLRKQ